MNSARINTPLTANSQFIQADDDDDLNDDDIPGFTHPDLTIPVDKGKGKAREPEQLAPPSNAGGTSLSPGLSGNIGSSVNGTAASSRQTVGGLRVETRYSGVDTLDEPVTTTIVCLFRKSTGNCTDTYMQARDLFSIYAKLVQVLYPRKTSGREVLRFSGGYCASKGPLNNVHCDKAAFRPVEMALAGSETFEDSEWVAEIPGPNDGFDMRRAKRLAAS
ncbi:hypothetical protein C0989_004102 [Termitomyces sp. Mn162]|nr:hypothetical protein C0989_004102 [Termitomyces sp. Mn162]